MDLKELETRLFGSSDNSESSSSGEKIISEEEVGRLADIASKRYNVPKALIRAVIDMENPKYDANAKNPKSTAKGLMQLIDGTADEMGVVDSTDPYQNVMGGAKYLRKMLTRYGGDQRKAVAAYFKGPKVVDEHKGDVATIGGDLGGTTAARYLNKVNKGLEKYGGQPFGESVDVSGEIDSTSIGYGSLSPTDTQGDRLSYLEKRLGIRPMKEGEIAKPSQVPVPKQEAETDSTLPMSKSAPIGATGSWQEQQGSGATGSWEETQEPQKDRNFIEKVVEAAKRGDVNAQLDFLAYEAMIGKRKWEDVETIISEFEKKSAKDPVEGNNWLSKSVLGLAGMLPAMGRGILEGQKQGMAGAIGAGGAAAIGGQMGPQLLAPEEIVTVPGAAGVGYAVGTAVGSTEYWREQGAGGAYRELKKSGVSDKTANVLAQAMSIPYALIERTQVTQAIPGADKALKKIINDTMTKKLVKIAGKYGKEVAEESLEEGIQGVLDQTAQEIGNYVDKTAKKKDIGDASLAVLKRFKDDFVNSIGPMMLLLGPKAGLDVYDTTKGTEKGDDKKTEVSAVTKEDFTGIEELRKSVQADPDKEATPIGIEPREEIQPIEQTGKSIGEPEAGFPELTERGEEVRNKAYGVEAVKGNPERFNEILDKIGIKSNEELDGLLQSLKDKPEVFNEKTSALNDRDFTDLEDMLVSGMRLTDVPEGTSIGEQGQPEVKEEKKELWSGAKSDRTYGKRLAQNTGLRFVGIDPGEKTNGKVTAEPKFIFEDESGNRQTVEFKTTAEKLKKTFGIKDAIGQKKEEVEPEPVTMPDGGVAEDVEVDLEDEPEEIIASVEQQQKGIDLVQELGDKNIELRGIQGGTKFKKSGRELGKSLLNIHDNLTHGDYYLEIDDNLTVDKLREHVSLKRKDFGVDEPEIRGDEQKTGSKEGNSDIQPGDAGETSEEKTGKEKKPGLKIGDKFTFEGRKYSVEEVEKSFGDGEYRYSFRDLTGSYPISRDERGTREIIEKRFGIKLDDSLFPEERKKVDSETQEGTPERKLIAGVKKAFAEGKKLDNPSFRKIAEESYGGTVAEGKYTSVQAYDVLETAVNEYISENSDKLKQDPEKTLEWLNSIGQQLPTQNIRNSEKKNLQQFSTPQTQGYVALKALGKSIEGLKAIEPSAGTGNLATLLKAFGAKVDTNELSESRRANLKELGFTPMEHDALQLDNILPAEQMYDVVLMNPPFSANAKGITGDTTFGARHVKQALRRLKKGGRLVAIVGRGMRFPSVDDPLGVKLMPWWTDIMKSYNVRANVGMDGKYYAKFGTTFDNNIIVIDNTGPTPGKDTAERVKNAIKGDTLSPEEILKVISPLTQEDIGGRIKKLAEGTGKGDTQEGLSDRRKEPDSDTDRGGVDRQRESESTEGDRDEPDGGRKTNTTTGRRSGASGRKGDRGDGKGGKKEISDRGRAKDAVGKRDDTGAGRDPESIKEAARKRFLEKQKARQQGDKTENQKKIEEAKDKRDDKLKEAQDLLKKLGRSFVKPEPNRLNMIGTEQAEIAFDAVAALVEAGIYEFEVIARQVAELAGEFLNTPGFKEAIEDAYDAYSEVDDQVSKRSTTIDKVLKAEKAEKKDTPKMEGVLEPNKEDRELAEKLENDDAEDGVFERYQVRKATFQNSKEHPARVVQSMSLAAVEPPNVTYTPKIPERKIKNGTLSDIQLEFITYAGQTHEQRLPNGMRREVLLGDGTGMGKGRQIAGVILDNALQGRKKAVWVTISKDLSEDAQRDLYDDDTKQYSDSKIEQKFSGVGVPLKFINMGKIGLRKEIDYEEGVVFVTYSTLRDDFKNGSSPRLEQLKKWMGDDFDGVLVFDESHQMKNAVESEMFTDVAKGETVEGSLQGQMGVSLKKAFPNARIVNASATSATTPVNLGYLTRMGLWGEGTGFKTFKHFLSTMLHGGIGAMEMLSRDMKALGAYFTRIISYKGVESEATSHALKQDEKRMYDSMADFWSNILREFEAAGSNAGMTTRELSNQMRAFYGMQQRFFLKLMTAIQLPTMLKDADEQLAKDRSVVISLYETNEGQVKEAVLRAKARGEDLDNIEVTPKDMMVQLVERYFPIHEWEEIINEDGSKGRRMVTDNNGNPVINRENYDKQQELIQSIRRLRLPGNPMDVILEHFGPQNVAEVTGRKERLEGGKYVKRKIQGFSQNDVNKGEIEEFQSGRKRVAMISGAASTGISLHSSLTKKNQQRRVFYALQLSWSADVQMQSFGRVHRSFQRVPPIIKLVTTDIASQSRLVNTTQKRLASMGAISAGHRESFSGGLFSTEDITDDYGKAALESCYKVWRYERNEDLQKMNVFDKEGKVKSSLEDDVNNFLNRIMVLPFDRQNSIFEEFYEARQGIYNRALEQGQIDTGVKKIEADDIRVAKEPEIVYTDPSGSVTKLVELEGRVKTTKFQYRPDGTHFVNKRGGAIYRLDTMMAGKYGLLNVRGNYYSAKIDGEDKHQFTASEFNQIVENFDKLEAKEAKQEWDKQYDETPEFTTRKYHLLTGLVFPIYDKIASVSGKFKVVRADASDGKSYLGLSFPAKALTSIKQKLGIGTPLGKATPKEIFDMIQGGAIIELDNNWKIKTSRVLNDTRIEIMFTGYPDGDTMRRYGAFEEVIGYTERWFIPTDEEKGVAVLEKLLKAHKAIRDATAGNSASAPVGKSKKIDKEDFEQWGGRGETEQAEEKFIAVLEKIVEGDTPASSASLPVNIPQKASTALKAVPITPRSKSVPVGELFQKSKGPKSGSTVKGALSSDKIGKHISFDPQNKSEKDTGFLTTAEKIYTDFKDLAFPVLKLEDIHDESMGIKKKTVKALDIAIERVRASASIAKQYIEDNLKPIFDELKKNRGETYVELVKYLVAKRTQWLYQNKESYVDTGLGETASKEFVDYIETGAHPYSEDILKSSGKIWEYSKKLLQIKKDHGVIDEDFYEALNEPFYVPFFRDMDKKAYGPSAGKMDVYTNTSKGIRRIKGSIRGLQIVDPVQGIMRQTYETIQNAYRTDVMNTVIDMAEESPEVGKYIQKCPVRWLKAGTIEHRGEIDGILRPEMEEFAKTLGITIEYKARLAKGNKKILGDFTYGMDRLRMLIGATEGTFAHELGHGFHSKVKWYNGLITKHNSEFERVADTRYEGQEVPASFVAYCRSREEKAAEFISMYITDRENLRKLAPNAIVDFEAHLLQDKVLSKMIDLKPSNVNQLRSVEVDNWVMDNSIPRDEDVISVLRNGRIVSYRAPKEVAYAIKYLNPSMFPLWARILMMPGNTFRAGAVGLNLDFAITNASRDQQDAAVNSRIIPVVDYFSSLKSYIFQDETYKAWVRQGGEVFGSDVGIESTKLDAKNMQFGNKYGQFLDAYYWKEYGILKGTAKLAHTFTGGAVLDAIKYIVSASEVPTRLAVYKAAQRDVPKWLKGYFGEKANAEEAIVMSRNATGNPQRFGRHGRTLNEVFPFINMALEGYDQMYQNYKKDPKRAILKAFIWAYAPLIGLWYWNREKERYKLVPAQEKMDYWIIMNPAGDDYFKISKGHVAKFVVNPTQMILEKATGLMTKDSKNLFLSLIESMSPVNTGTIHPSVRLLLEPMANYDFYWQEAIEKPAIKNILVPGMRSDNKTSELLKTVGKALNISPIMMQHELEVLGAGTVKNALWIADLSMGNLDAKKFKLERAPIARRFYGKTEEWKSDISDAIREINVELNKVRKLSPRQLTNYYGYDTKETGQAIQANVKEQQKLIKKRNQLQKAQEAIGKMQGRSKGF